MPREVVAIQVGQCGNQIGQRFWELALREHALCSEDRDTPSLPYTDALSSFFRNVDSKSSTDLPVGSDVKSLRARAVLIDTEEGVVRQTLNSSIGSLFSSSIITDVSGAGNNFAHGFAYYGEKYRESIAEAVRQQVESCDSFSSFFCAYSLGGGTGSGLGSFCLSQLEDIADGFKFVSAVFPNLDEGTDVVTAPYNTVMSLYQLAKHSSCVLPVGNDALGRLSYTSASSQAAPISALSASSAAAGSSGKRASFDRMNNTVARCWLDLTASSRFAGPLNVDLTDITTNLVPFPSCKFLVPGLAPLQGSGAPRSVSQLFSDACSPATQLLNVDIRAPAISLAQGFIVRGGLSVGEVGRQIDRLMGRDGEFEDENRGKIISSSRSDFQTRSAPVIKMRPIFRRPYYLADAFKIGICSSPPFGVTGNNSVLSLSNSTGITALFEKTRERFMKLYTRKAHIHHYLEYMETADFQEALEGLDALMAEYSEGRFAEACDNKSKSSSLNGLGLGRLIC